MMTSICDCINIVFLVFVPQSRVIYATRLSNIERIAFCPSSHSYIYTYMWF